MGRMDAAFFEAPARKGPRRPPPDPNPERSDPSHGPLINAPWAAAFVASIIVGGYAVQAQFPIRYVANAMAFAPKLLWQGHAERLVTYNFAHGNWAHALMNAAFALAFGAPLARYFGERVVGALIFMAFYLACGVAAALAYAVIPGTAENALIGASAAVSGLMGGAARIIAGRGEVGGILSRPVIAMGAAWVILNLIFAAVGASFIPGAGDAPVAWQAHLTGYVAGVLLLTPFAWLARRV